jgi:hypothetical protein
MNTLRILIAVAALGFAAVPASAHGFHNGGGGFGHGGYGDHGGYSHGYGGYWNYSSFGFPSYGDYDDNSEYCKRHDCPSH